MDSRCRGGLHGDRLWRRRRVGGCAETAHRGWARCRASVGLRTLCWQRCAERQRHRCVSLYLPTGQAFSEAYWEMLHDVRQALSLLGHSRWVIGADWQAQPEDLEKCGWLGLLGGFVACAGTPTCGERELDFFVVSEALRHCVKGVAAQQVGTRPHCAVVLDLELCPQRRYEARGSRASCRSRRQWGAVGLRGSSSS